MILFMERFLIKGGKRLEGSVYVRGAKNSFTKIMVGALLTNEVVVLEGCPATIELALTADLLQEIGARVGEPKHGKIIIHAGQINNYRVSRLSRKNRIPILAIAPLLHRLGKAEVPYVGGDAIGARPVNFHLSILRKMGAKIKVKKDSYAASARRLKGATVSLSYPSVGATETGILAGVLAEGKTVIKNAAAEPEVIDLISFLQKMGALIELDTNRVITIDGVKRLRGTEHKIIPDRNEAVSFAILAIATGGDVLVQGARQDHLITFLNAVRRVGGEYQVENDGIRFYRQGPLKPLAIETSPHPGFMTDWQQPFAVLLMQAKGISKIHETVYEDRFGYIKDFVAMGAKIDILERCLGASCRFAKKNYPHSIRIHGPTKLHGSKIVVQDIRAGLAHIVAALAAKGVTEMDGIEHIDRGYEHIDTRLREIGADIRRI